MTDNITDIGFRQGDNSQAFDKHAIKIDLRKSEDEDEVSRVEFVTGCIVKSYPDPVFPIYVDFNEEESAKLRYINVGYLVAYDKKGRQLTCNGFIRFTIKNGVICKC